jgi:hypothetical protein
MENKWVNECGALLFNHYLKLQGQNRMALQHAISRMIVPRQQSRIITARKIWYRSWSKWIAKSINHKYLSLRDRDGPRYSKRKASPIWCRIETKCKRPAQHKLEGKIRDRNGIKDLKPLSKMLGQCENENLYEKPNLSKLLTRKTTPKPFFNLFQAMWGGSAINQNYRCDRCQYV